MSLSLAYVCQIIAALECRVCKVAIVSRMCPSGKTKIDFMMLNGAENLVSRSYLRCC